MLKTKQKNKCEQYNSELPNDERNKMDPKYDPENLFPEGYDYRVWSENEEESTDKIEPTDKDLSLFRLRFIWHATTRSNKEEVKEGKGLKILTPNKLLTRLPMLLAQIKAVNN